MADEAEKAKEQLENLAGKFYFCQNKKKIFLFIFLSYHNFYLSWCFIKYTSS